MPPYILKIRRSLDQLLLKNKDLELTQLSTNDASHYYLNADSLNNWPNVNYKETTFDFWV